MDGGWGDVCSGAGPSDCGDAGTDATGGHSRGGELAKISTGKGESLCSGKDEVGIGDSDRGVGQRCANRVFVVDWSTGLTSSRVPLISVNIFVSMETSLLAVHGHDNEVSWSARRVSSTDCCSIRGISVWPTCGDSGCGSGGSTVVYESRPGNTVGE